MKQINSDVHSRDIEELVLGQTISFSKKEVISFLIDDDFFFQKHKLVFRLVVDLYESGIEISATSILERSREIGNYSDDLPSFIIDMLQKNSLEVDIDPYISILRNKAISRKIIDFLNDSVSNFRDLINSPEKLLENYKKKIGDIESCLNSKVSKERGKKLRDFLNKGEGDRPFIEEIKHRFLNKESINRNLLNTGFKDLDSKTFILNNSNLIILAARPALGKTSLALNIAINLALKEVPICFFSLEMSPMQIIERIISMRSRVSCEEIRRGTFSSFDLSKIEEIGQQLYSLPFFIFDHKCSNVSYLFKEVRKLKEKENIKVIFIDYIQLLQGSKNFDNRQGEVADISRKLKLLAIELNIPIFCLSQLSRKVEDRQEKRPVISDLRDSGQLEQDADIVMFLYDKDKDSINEGKSKTIEVFLGKNRHGALFSSLLKFESSCGIFEGIDNEW